MTNLSAKGHAEFAAGRVDWIEKSVGRRLFAQPRQNADCFEAEFFDAAANFAHGLNRPRNIDRPNSYEAVRILRDETGDFIVAD